MEVPLRYTGCPGQHLSGDSNCQDKTYQMCVKGSCEMLPSPEKSTDTLAVAVNPKDEVYNPFEHRHLEHPTSTIGSFFHLLKSSLGAGILSMPMAFKHTGLIPGCIGTVLVGIIATHCVHILVATSREISSECHIPYLSYTDTCEKVFKHGPKRLRRFSNFVRHFADCAMAAVCLGGTSVYVIFIATSLQDICYSFFPDHRYGVQAYCGMLLPLLILITQIRYLKFLVPFSVVANLCLVVTFGITCFYTFVGLPDVSEANLTAEFTKWPLFLSTAIFAMEGINVVMPVENEMAKPERFLGCPGVLNTTMVFVTVLYGVVGFFGYLKYGNAVKGSVTLNLPQDKIYDNMEKKPSIHLIFLFVHLLYLTVLKLQCHLHTSPILWFSPTMHHATPLDWNHIIQNQSFQDRVIMRLPHWLFSCEVVWPGAAAASPFFLLTCIYRSCPFCLSIFCNN